MFKALEDTMETGAEAGDPTWLALLVSWPQSMASVRPGHALRKSVPIERFEGWMLFFCKGGKHKHNRAGFYLGVPSGTSSGYDWAKRFLYDLRRQRDVGKEMMGMIFRQTTTSTSPSMR